MSFHFKIFQSQNKNKLQNQPEGLRTLFDEFVCVLFD